jgi:predicted AAA+ superfamily ATPase
MAYKNRLVDKLLSAYLEGLPAVLIEGGKAVGKTETATQFAKTILDMTDRTTRELYSIEPSLALTKARPVLIDEWQNVPELWSVTRRAIDNGLGEGSVIFTGSSLKTQSDLHTGAGRIVRMKMRPFSIEERGMSDSYIRMSDMLKPDFEMAETTVTNKTISDYLDEIYRSGFPGIRERNEIAREALIDGYIENLINKEFAENGFAIRKPNILRLWLRGYAAAISTSTTINAISQIAQTFANEEMTKSTIKGYREALEALGIIEEVPAWLPAGKTNAQLRKANEHFLIDPALATTLLGVEKEHIERYKLPEKVTKFTTTFLGQLLESFVYQSLATYAEINRAQISYLRSANGSKEIDFIVQKGYTILLFEVKASAEITSDDVENLNWFEEEFGEEFRVVKNIVYAGKIATTLEGGINQIPIAMLGC